MILTSLIDPVPPKSDSPSHDLFFIQVSCNKQPLVTAFIDSGANMNLISLKYYQTIAHTVSSSPSQSNNHLIELQTITGQTIKVYKTIYLQLTVGRTMTSTPLIPFYVIDHLPHLKTILLGMYFIREYILEINVATRTLRTKLEPAILIPLLSQQEENNHLMSVVSEAITICLIRSLKLPPHSIAYVKVKSPNKPMISSELVEYLYEPEGRIFLETGVTAANALVTGKDQISVIGLVNNSSRSHQLHAEDRVGTLSVIRPDTNFTLPSSAMINHVMDVPLKQSDQEQEKEFNDTLRSVLNSDRCSLTPSQIKLMRMLITKNRSAFSMHSPLKTTTLTSHRIDTGDNLPVFVPPYRVGPAQTEEISRQTQQMLENNIIRPSDSPYASPVILVKKADGSYRFCIDYRKLNAITKRDVYPLPRIDDMLDALGKAIIFTTFDLESGFWQIPVHPDDIEKTAFNTQQGHYEFRVLPFGLTNAPSTFQRVMDRVLRPHQAYCKVFVDDIIIFSDTVDQHYIHVQNVLTSINNARMTIKLKKCKMGKNEVRFLGHLVSHRTIKPDPEKIAAVKAFPVPTTVVQLQSFIGLVGYYRRFIRQLSTTAEPLYKLLKKNSVWHWTLTHQNAFDKLKTALTSSPLLSLPDFTQTFYLHTDASLSGLGAVLCQKTDEAEHPICYASKTLNAAQRNYTVTEQEALAVVWAVKLFRPYLLGRPFFIVTDHSALKSLFKHKDTSSRLMRMILQLQDYDYTIIHRPGTQNTNADVLSRLPALLERQDTRVHCLVSAVTRSSDNTLPAFHRTGVDPDLVLDPNAYDLERALRESQSNYNHVTEREHEDDEAHSEQIELQDVKNDYYDEDHNSLHITESKHDDTVNMDDDQSHESTPVSAPTTSNSELELMEHNDHGTNRMKNEQRADPLLKPIIQYLETKNLPKDTSSAQQLSGYNTHYKLMNSLLYYDISEGIAPPKNTSRFNLRTRHHEQASTLRIVVPSNMSLPLLQEYHDGPCGAHLGLSKTYDKIGKKYYWPHMYSDIRTYILTCDKCVKRKTRQEYKNLPIGSIPSPSLPFECLGIDILGPLPETNVTHYKYILVIVDHFTRWPFAFPMTNHRAKTIADLLVERVFMEHGFPATLLSDRGTEFLSELMMAVLQIFRVKKLNTSAYHPQTNGMTERFNQTLTIMLTHYVQKYQTDWDRYLPYLLFAYRTAAHASTLQSPFFLVYGREARYPFETLSSQADATDVETECKADDARRYVTDLITRLKLVHDVVKQRDNDAQLAKDERNKEIRDRMPQYAVGSLVLLYTPVVVVNTVKKLTALWRGPYQVLEIMPNRLNYRIQLVNKRGVLIMRSKPLFVHVSRLKQYHRPDSSSIRQSGVEMKPDL